MPCWSVIVYLSPDTVRWVSIKVNSPIRIANAEQWHPRHRRGRGGEETRQQLRTQPTNICHLTFECKLIKCNGCTLAWNLSRFLFQREMLNNGIPAYRQATSLQTRMRRGDNWDTIFCRAGHHVLQNVLPWIFYQSMTPTRDIVSCKMSRKSTGTEIISRRSALPFAFYKF